MLDLVVGFDAGGTSTKCALMTTEGQVVARGSAGPGNYQLIREEGVRQVLTEAFNEAVQSLDAQAQILGAFLGIAGATTASERSRILAVCQGLGIAPVWRVMGDMVPALAAGTGGGEGIVIVGGTGSISWGCDATGATARAGGWGYLLGDEGSGYDIGQKALIAAFQSYDGRGPKTSLNNRILHSLGCTDILDLVGTVYSHEQPRTMIASLAPLVIEAAHDGDSVAGSILEGAAGEYVSAILAVYRQLHFETEVTVVATGGLFQGTEALFQRVRLLLSPVLPEARLVVPDVDPVVGACYLALRAVRGDMWPPKGD